VKTIVITGATEGMGKALALTYLERGDNVVIVGRSAPADLPIGERAHAIRADLSVVAENRRVIAEIKARFPVVDTLIFCARHFNSQRIETRDMFEHTTAVFYLSRFLLAEGLLECLERAERPIVMSLSGPGEGSAKIYWDDLALTRNYHGGAALEQAGRLADLHARSLVDRHPEARTRYILFHPGVVSTTFSGTYDEATAPHIEMLKRTGKPIAEAIEPILAVLDAPPDERFTAFVEGRPFPTDGPSFDLDEARRVYDITLRMLNRVVLRRFIEEAIDKGDIDALDECIHPDVVLPPDMPGGLQGREALVAHLREMPEMFESKATIEDLIAEGDKVAARVGIRGHQIGEFMGRPGDGHKFAIEEQLIAQFRNGKIGRIWRVVDVFSLLAQLDGTAADVPHGEARHHNGAEVNVSVEENREKLRRLLEEVSSSGNYDVLDEYVHEDVVLPPHMPEAGNGREALKAALAAYDDVLEYQDVVEDTIAEGDKVAARIVTRGKLNGEFLGMRGDGQEFTIDEMMIAQFRDGKISQIWRVADLFSLTQQIGGAPVQAAS
jgi:predicted ester cyclase/NAD(P)-dependent dehydrogenase (short-subunit alcohol dehydrogenase family)